MISVPLIVGILLTCPTADMVISEVWSTDKACLCSWLAPTKTDSCLLVKAVTDKISVRSWIAWQDKYHTELRSWSKYITWWKKQTEVKKTKQIWQREEWKRKPFPIIITLTWLCQSYDYSNWFFRRNQDTFSSLTVLSTFSVKVLYEHNKTMNLACL